MHNKDTSEDGKPKTPHYHFAIRLIDSYDTKHIAEWFGIKENFIQKVKGKWVDMLQYLTHENAPEKYQYSTDEVISNYDWQNEKDDFLFRRTNRYVKKQNDALANSRCFDGRIRKYCNNANLDFVKSPYDVRRTYITALYEGGINIDIIRKIAGHTDTSMTMRYCKCRLTNEEITTGIEKLFKSR